MSGGVIQRRDLGETYKKFNHFTPEKLKGKNLKGGPR
jgi:hypothetical protein